MLTKITENLWLDIALLQEVFFEHDHIMNNYTVIYMLVGSHNTFQLDADEVQIFKKILMKFNGYSEDVTCSICEDHGSYQVTGIVNEPVEIECECQKDKEIK